MLYKFLIMGFKKIKDGLPPVKIEFDLIQESGYLVVICEHTQRSKRQTSLACYDFISKVWMTHWGEIIDNVEYWCEMPC